MPSSIPYDPSLELASVVSNAAVNVFNQISEVQAPVKAAHEDLNALLASRRSLDMTKTELYNLGISTEEIEREINDLDMEISQSAVRYAKEKMTAERSTKPLRAQAHSANVRVESPVDYVKSQIKSMPLAVDSMKMDVQYFALDPNQMSSASFASTISSFVSSSTSWMDTKASGQMSDAAQKQVSQQASQHSISGTLVMSVSCTHKNASVLAPFVLDVDKGIKTWNNLFPNDRLNPQSRSEMEQLAQSTGLDGESNKFSIISGMSFGSSFVGMVHFLNTADTTIDESISKVASSLQAKMDAGAWFEKASGGFGVNSSIANDVKNLLSSQSVASHVSLICLGTIPSIVSNQVKQGVEKFSQADPKAGLSAIATIQNATVANQDTIKQSADVARTGKQVVSLRAGDINATLSALGELDNSSNKVLDVNSMMTALEDYVQKAADGNSGIPINYYLKDITKGMLAEMWLAKYYPGEYIIS